MAYRFLRPILFRLPPETAHELALHSLSLVPLGFIKRRLSNPISCFGLTFPNPVGLAAGFDKNGIALQSLAALGLGLSKRARLRIIRNLEIRGRACSVFLKIRRSSIAQGSTTKARLRSSKESSVIDLIACSA